MKWQKLINFIEMSSSASSSILYEAAKETLVEYFQKTSLSGFGLLYYIRRRKYQRFFWFMFIAMGVSFSIYVCATIMLSFLSEPLVTSLDTEEQTIWDVPFPSIAVCSNNKLSRTAIKDYAQNMSKSDPNSQTTSQWLKKLELFAGFYNTDSIDFDEALKLQNQLDATYGGTFNTGEILKQLSPKCQDLLLKCFWSGKPINCVDELKLMAFVKGHCCVFNYHYERSKVEDLYYPYATGAQMGLTLLLNGSINDYFYAEGSSNGFTIQLFRNQRIPDASTGQVAEFNVDPGDSMEVKLTLITQITTTQARDHPVSRRGCYFPNEHIEAAQGQPGCLFNCKMRSMEHLCGCTPFYAYEGGPNQTLTQCTLAQTECLERYRVTWQTYNPSDSNINDILKAELLDSLSCPECLPLCSFHKCQFRKIVDNLRDIYNYHDNKIFLESVAEPSPDLSLVKIYFISKYGTRYQRTVLYNWYQMLSNIGGVIGICIGCSIISGCEILYFGIVRLFENYLKLKANRR